MSEQSESSGKDRAREVFALFQKGAEFTRELLEENDRLRRRLLAFQEEQRSAAEDPQAWDRLRTDLTTRIQDLEAENRDARERLLQVERENRQFADRYVAIEEENNNLANLYVASYQLHSTLDLPEVLKVVVEIVINLIGAEEFAIYVLDERSGRLDAVAGEGRSTSDFPPQRFGEGLVGRAAACGEIRWNEGADRSDGAPLVCIPLQVKERPVGAIVIHRLLEQKQGFSDLDRELFALLAGHAATALCAARLFADSERKLNTIQGFLELLTE